jgi:uncharacterized protein
MSLPPPTRHGPLRWLGDALLVASLLPLGAAAAFCVALSYKIYHPPRRRNRPAPETSLALDAARIRTRDGVALAAWIARRPEPKGTVVICHEWGSHKATKLKHAEFLHAAGYDVALFDLRNHGESAADRSWGQMSRRYTDDLEAVIQHVAADPELGTRPIAVLSFSFSTFPTMHCRARRDPRGLRALVFDSGPGWDEGEITANFLAHFGKEHFPAWLRGPLLFPFAAGLARRLATRLLHVTHWPPALEQVSTPMLFICGEADPIMPPASVRPFARAAPRARFWEVPGAGHLQAYKVDPARYREVVVGFLDEACAAAPGLEGAG